MAMSKSVARRRFTAAKYDKGTVYTPLININHRVMKAVFSIGAGETRKYGEGRYFAEAEKCASVS